MLIWLPIATFFNPLPSPKSILIFEIAELVVFRKMSSEILKFTFNPLCFKLKGAAISFCLVLKIGVSEF